MEKTLNKTAVKVFLCIVIIGVAAAVIYSIIAYPKPHTKEANYREFKMPTVQKTPQEIAYDKLVSSDSISMKDLTQYFELSTGKSPSLPYDWSNSWEKALYMPNVFVFDVIKTDPENLILDQPFIVYFKKGSLKDFDNTFDISGLSLIKIDPKTFQPVKIATYGSRDWFHTSSGFSTYASEFNIPRTVDTSLYTAMSSPFLDSRDFFYDKDYYYMLAYFATIPTPHGTPTEFVYTSNLFKILPEAKK
jgi:hypothetical protein